MAASTESSYVNTTHHNLKASAGDARDPQIPVQTGPATAPDALDPTVAVLLCEIEVMLDALLSTGECHSIDLHRTPLTTTEQAALREVLGDGELSATLTLLGPTYARETSIPGVWWITHCNREGDVISEFIEVTTCPQLLCSQRADMGTGLERLRARIKGRSTRAPDPRDVAASQRALGLDLFSVAMRQERQ